MTNRMFTTIALALFATIASAAASGGAGWTSAQIDELRSMSLASLEPLPPDPTNRVADDLRAADLGKRLFFNTRLNANGSVACDEIAGLKLIIGKANCTQCHNGPLFTNNEFHNTGVPRHAELPSDEGRVTGASTVLKDEFNCRSRWSDAPRKCAELEFLVTGDHTLERAYKVPSLRNVAGRALYMNSGQFATPAEVLEHYNRAPAAQAGQTELKPLRLKAVELTPLQAFLSVLSGPIVVNGLQRSVSMR